MSVLFFLFSGLSLLVALLTAPTLLRPGLMRLKLSALGLAAVLIGLFHVSGTELLGRPKPTRMEIVDTARNDVAVIASHMVEGEAIYLWLEAAGDPEPRAYSLPWSQQSAEELQEATQTAENTGTAVRVRSPFDTASDDVRPVFYATPQQAPPPKNTGRSTSPNTRAGDTRIGDTRIGEAGGSEEQEVAPRAPDLGIQGRRINLLLAPVIVIERDPL